MIDLCHRGSLLNRILTMGRKKPIPFEHAVRMAQEKYRWAMDNRQFGSSRGQSFWYLSHFVEWISDLGYHIELTGDEFEPYQMSSQVQ